VERGTGGTKRRLCAKKKHVGPGRKGGEVFQERKKKSMARQTKPQVGRGETLGGKKSPKGEGVHWQKRVL